MARNTRRRTVREDEGQTRTSPVQLREARRFYSAQGNDGPVRTARALTQAFGAGTQLFEQIVEKRNEEGASQAAFEAAQGGTRGNENQTKGYQEMWDQIEAANDLHLFSKELPEVLRGADWENLTEDEAQGVIDGYYQGQLEGINANSVYGKMVAEGILKQNAQLIDTHRTFQLERLRQEQRIMIGNEARRIYETDGVIPYDLIASRTNTAFDGADKMAAYWELLEGMAIEFKDENILLQAPERFPSSDPTGITDPKFYNENIFPGVQKAIAAREAEERKQAAAAEAHRKALREDGMREMIEAVIRGEDPTGIGMDLLTSDVIEGSDYTSAISAFRSMRDDRSKQGADYTKVAELAANIAVDVNSVSVEELLTVYSNGIMGPPDSPEAQSTFRGLLDDRQQAKDRQVRLAADPQKKIWVNRFKQAFPAPTSEFGLPKSGPLTELRAEYVAAMEIAILGAGSPEQYREIYTQLSTQYKDAERLTTAQESASTISSSFKQLARGNFTTQEAAAHIRSQGWTVEHLINAKQNKDIAVEDGSPEAEAYRALLQEFAK